MLQHRNLEDLVANRFLMQSQSLDLAFDDADHFDAAECSDKFAGEVGKSRGLLRRDETGPRDHSRRKLGLI